MEPLLNTSAYTPVTRRDAFKEVKSAALTSTLAIAAIALIGAVLLYALPGATSGWMLPTTIALPVASLAALGLFAARKCHTIVHDMRKIEGALQEAQTADTPSEALLQWENAMEGFSRLSLSQQDHLASLVSETQQNISGKLERVIGELARSENALLCFETAKNLRDRIDLFPHSPEIGQALETLYNAKYIPALTQRIADAASIADPTASNQKLIRIKKKIENKNIPASITRLLDQHIDATREKIILREIKNPSVSPDPIQARKELATLERRIAPSTLRKPNFERQLRLAKELIVHREHLNPIPENLIEE